MNKVIFMGRLGKDLELKYTQDGKAVVTMSVAISEGERTTWVRVSAWEKQAENCAKHLKKGSKVLIDGKLRENSWTGKTGEKRTQLEVVANFVTFLDGRPAESGAPYSEASTGTRDHQQSQASGSYTSRDSLDDLPF